MTQRRPVHIRQSFFALMFGIAAAFGSTARAEAACPAGTQYMAPFMQADQTWDTDEKSQIGGGQLIDKLKAGDGDTILFKGDTVATGTICADFTLTTPSDDGSSAGLAFWAPSYHDYYIFQIDPLAGTFGVDRKKSDKWSQPISWRKSSAVKLGVGAINELSVTLAGNQATLSINGTSVAQFAGFPPTDPGYSGVHGEGGEKLGAVWATSNFVIGK